MWKRSRSYATSSSADDPAIHDAVRTEPGRGRPPGTVLEVLRAERVVVASDEADAARDAAAGPDHGRRVRDE
ncbi:MAG: hypothetical protein ACYCO9_20300 [Streptosporangiaceae bacterium]